MSILNYIAKVTVKQTFGYVEFRMTVIPLAV